MGSQGFEPRSWDISCLSTPIDHHNKYCSVTRIFSSKTTGVPDDARLHYNPTNNIQYNLCIKEYINFVLKYKFSAESSFTFIIIFNVCAEKVAD